MTADLTTPSAVLEAIAERLAAATGPDSVLDQAVWEACGAKRRGGLTSDWWLGHAYLGRSLPRITASLDAVLSLVEAKCPGFQRIIGEHAAPGLRGQMWRGTLIDETGRETFQEWGPTPALALLRALVAALAAQSTGEKENEG